MPFPLNLEQDVFPLWNPASRKKKKKATTNPQNIILEIIQRDDKREISEISDDVKLIWCLLGAEWLLYEMKIKVSVYVCIDVWQSRYN